MDVGAPELILILVIAIVVFGAGKLGQVGAALGKSVKEFREAANPDPAAKTATPPATTPAQGASDDQQASG